MPGDKYTMHLSETGELALSISPVTPADEGYYTCQIRNESGQCYCEAPLFIDGKTFPIPCMIVIVKIFLPM